MHFHAFLASLTPLLLAGTFATAQSVTVGQDLYVGGDAAAAVPRAERNLFVGGPAVRLTEPVGRDAHIGGFSVQIEAETAGDLYAAGGDLRIEAPVLGDLSAIGFSVELGDEAAVGGNARVSGGSVLLDGPVAGALVTSGGSVEFNSDVGGDAWIAAGNVEFGPDARIGGILHITTSGPTEVPESVATPDRVVFEALDPDDMPPRVPDWGPGWPRDMQDDWGFSGPVAFSAAALLTLAFLVALGAVFLAAAPEKIEALRARAATRPWIVLLLGIGGLSALVGLVPVSAATLVGLPLVPIAILGAIVLWTLGYLLGTYAAAFHLLKSLRPNGQPTGTGSRVSTLALGLLIAAVLNFVPFLGWITNLMLGFIGIGAIVLVVAQWAMLPKAEPSAPTS